MGLCVGKSTPEERAARAATRKLDQQNKLDYQAEASKIKLLLLGAGESGKSTFFKQMKKLYGAGFTDEDRETAKIYVHQNIMQTAIVLCEAASLVGVSLSHLAPQVERISKLVQDMPVTPEIAADIKALWQDTEVRRVWDARLQFQDTFYMPDTAAQLMQHVEVIGDPSYTPSDTDVLLARQKTSGIHNEEYVINEVTFVITDVGGQRNERKKWIHCFDGVHAVMFVVGLAEYDQSMEEDPTANRMEEALQIFNDICNHPLFTTTDMILLLNKRDLFTEKVARVNIASVPAFSDYSGKPFDYDDGVAYFVRRFVSLNRTTKTIHNHVTCATDAQNAELVFNDCRQIVLQKNLAASGLGG